MKRQFFSLGDERMRRFVADYQDNLQKFVCLVVTDEKIGEGVIWLDGEEKMTPPVGYISAYLPNKLLEKKEIGLIRDKDGRDVYYDLSKNNIDSVLELASRV